MRKQEFKSRRKVHRNKQRGRRGMSKTEKLRLKATGSKEKDREGSHLTSTKNMLTHLVAKTHHSSNLD